MSPIVKRPADQVQLGWCLISAIEDIDLLVVGVRKFKRSEDTDVLEDFIELQYWQPMAGTIGRWQVSSDHIVKCRMFDS